jgi:hypothetical protein
VTTTDHPTRTQPTDTRPSPGTPRHTALTVVGFGIACMLACSLPLLIGGGAAAAVGAFVSGAGLLAAILATVAADGALWWVVRRSRARADAASTASGSACGCGSSGC